MDKESTLRDSLGLPRIGRPARASLQDQVLSHHAVRPFISKPALTRAWERALTLSGAYQRGTCILNTVAIPYLPSALFCILKPDPSPLRTHLGEN